MANSSRRRRQDADRALDRAIAAHNRALAFPPRDPSDGPGPPPRRHFHRVGYLLWRQQRGQQGPVPPYALNGLTDEERAQFLAAGLRIETDEEHDARIRAINEHAAATRARQERARRGWDTRRRKQQELKDDLPQEGTPSLKRQ